MPSSYLQQETAGLVLTDDDLADVVVTDRYVTQHNGVTHLYLLQRYRSIEVFNGVINVNISRDGEVISVGNRFVPDLAQAVNTDTPGLTATEAVVFAAQELKLDSTAQIDVIEHLGGPAQESRIRAPGVAQNAIPAKLVYERLAANKVRLAWSLFVDPPEEQHSWHLRVDAVTGAILAQDDLILHDSESQTLAFVKKREQPRAANATQPISPLTPPTYRVVPAPLEHPNDGPGLPEAQSLVDDPADALASPYSWHDIDGTPGHEFMDTRGNNVSAQEDRNDDNYDGFRPTGLDPDDFNFDYSLDPTLDPTAGNNTAAAIVNLFYWNNILHDIAYHYGFDEAAGNFQVNNYARGGQGADAIQADVQDAYDWGARNNAYFEITPDGIAPRMGMYVFDYTSPNRDSAFDNGIVIHEYAHGISTRLVGGPGNPYCLFSAEQMGEGWSDWFTLALTAKADDTGSERRGVGTYVLGQTPGSPGIRRYPYSTDMAVNPLTYGDMSESFGDIYEIGEIWASMLWEMQWRLIEQHGFDPDLYAGSGGNNMALQLVIDGMKFAPCDPGFVDARDAILNADQVANNGANQCPIWQAFAKRGLGVNAEQGSPYDTRDGIESFDVPLDCRDDLSLTKHGSPEPAEAGKVLTYELVAGNYTDQPVTGVLLQDLIPDHTTYVADSAGDGGSETGGLVTWQLPTLNPDESVVRTFQVTVDRDYPDPAEIYFDDMENDGVNWTGTGLWRRIDDADACGKSFSPTHSWYYGDTPSCMYRDGSSGELTTVNPIGLPQGNVMLKFMSWEEYEICCDGMEMLVSTDGVNFDRIWSANNSRGAWHEVSADLSAYAGQSVWLRFAFRSDSSVTYRGWYVDDVRLIAAQDIVNSATLTTDEGLSASATSANRVIKTPGIAVAPAAFDETLNGGETVVRTLTITNVGAAPLTYELVESNQSLEKKTSAEQAPDGQTSASGADFPASAPAPTVDMVDEPSRPTEPSYAGDPPISRETLPVEPIVGGLTGSTGSTGSDVLILAAADVYQIQAILSGDPDLGRVDVYDARFGTPTLDELAAYATVVVISNSPFEDATAVGNLLADYVDGGGTVVQAVATFYDYFGDGWGLRGRFVDDGYSPFSGIGDWFWFAELGEFDANHPIMQDVTYAGDSFRQMVDLTTDAQWVASWTDDEFVATKGSVVALNTFLADGNDWVGDIPLIVHNSIIWLQSQGGSDVPWLSAAPITGTLASGESQSIELTFDASANAIELAGDYEATLKILSNDPHSRRVDVPVTLHVLGPELSIVNTPNYFGREAAVPVALAGNGLDVAAAAFSIDFDETCLDFDTTDANGNGIPDAVKLKTPPGFELVVRTDISDTNGELDLFIGDLTPPISALPDGALLTIGLKAVCQAEEEPLPVRVGFGASPAASFSDLSGGAVLGLVTDGVVEIQLGLPGDCNQDGLVNAADAVSCVLEIFDGDGSFWLDATGGTYPGSPQGCDSNLDEQIDAGDILCTVLTLFEGQGACSPADAVMSARASVASSLAIPQNIDLPPDGTVTVPVLFTGNGNAIAATVFTLTYDPAVLHLDQSDLDGNGIPDAVAFNVPEGVTTSATVVDDRQIQIAIADLSLPFVTLPDETLVNITFALKATDDEQAQTTAITFAGDLPASVGTHRGQSAAVMTQDGSVLIATAPADEQLTQPIYLPLIER